MDTGEGLVLIDALYGDFPQLAMKHLESLGLGDREIKYVLVTHGHWDHAGGSAFFQKEVGATVGMTQADWVLARGSAARSGGGLFSGGIPEQQRVISDGDELKVGDTTFRCYVTPGHTEGVLSLEFMVKDGERQHRAIVFGGVGLNFSGVARTESYLESVKRIRALAVGKPAIEVSLSNHPGMAKVLERRNALARRVDGEGHPFVDAAGFLEDLKGFREAAEQKLKGERAAAGQ